MTRKACNNHPHVDTLLQSVCPELFKSDPREALETLLKANEIVLSKVIASMTRNKMPRTRSSSDCYKVKHSFSPINNDVKPRLRARKYTPYINSFIDTSGDDDSNHVTPIRELRSTTKLAMLRLKSNHESDVWDSGRPKRTCIKQKRISADERLVVDNRTYYRVQLMSNKLRSSGFPIRNSETLLSKKIKSPPSEDSIDDKSLLVKVKRQKISELVRLNNEAENFLFPRKYEVSNSENETDTEVRVNTCASKKEIVPNNLNSRLSKIKNEPEEETSMDSISSESSITKKKRRLTQAEAFILDNQQYYKFETPGSRLRYQGSYLPSLATKNNGEYNAKHAKTKVPEGGVRPAKLKLNDINYSFEIVPQTEPWYKTFQRQDRGEECYTCYNYSSDYCNPFLLPYELGPLPPLNPSVCFTAYNYKKKQLFGESGPSTSTDCNIEDACSTGEDTKSSEDSELLNVPLLTPKLPVRRHRRGLLSNSKTPRKSPRQHASTLAILSSLIQQRKRRGEGKRSRNASKQNLTSINEEMEISEVDCDTIASNINDMLSNSLKEMDLLDINTNEETSIDLHYKLDIIETLQSYSNMETVCNSLKPAKKVNANGPIIRKHWRKKKKNRTGWPNKNKRTVFRKDGSDNRKDRGKSNVAKCRKKRNKSDNNHNKKLSNFVEGRSANVNKKINGNIQISKLNGVSDNINLTMPRRKEHRDSSSDNCAEVVVASVGDKIDCVNVDLDKWENAERVLSAKIRSEDINNDIQFQPIVRVQKLDSDLTLKCIKKEISVSPSPRRTRSRRMPASPKSPRMLRKQRGGWYRHNNN